MGDLKVTGHTAKGSGVVYAGKVLPHGLQQRAQATCASRKFNSHSVHAARQAECLW